jgi:hypothetical protein
MLAQWLKASCCGAKPIATAALGQTRKFSVFRATSGLPQEADIVGSTRYFRNVPITEVTELIRSRRRRMRARLLRHQDQGFRLSSS